jgi:hypothetical protein
MSYLEEFNRNQKAMKDAERQTKLGSTRALHQFQSKNQSEFERNQKERREKERHDKNKTKEILNSYHHHHQASGDRNEQHLLLTPPPTRAGLRKLTLSSSNSSGLDHIPIPDPETRNMTKSSSQNNNDSGTSSSSSQRRLVELTFLFGLIYDDDALEPDAEECQLAAASIVPAILSHSVKETANHLRCDPKSKPLVVSSGTTGCCAEIDDWFDREGSERYVIRGTVPVYLFLNNNESTKTKTTSNNNTVGNTTTTTTTTTSKSGCDIDIDIEQTAAPLQKLLKRHVSFRPIAPDDAKKEKNKDLLVGQEGGRQWIRVRESRLGGLGITF